MGKHFRDSDILPPALALPFLAILRNSHKGGPVRYLTADPRLTTSWNLVHTGARWLKQQKRLKEQMVRMTFGERCPIDFSGRIR